MLPLKQGLTALDIMPVDDGLSCFQEGRLQAEPDLSRAVMGLLGSRVHAPRLVPVCARFGKTKALLLK